MPDTHEVYFAVFARVENGKVLWFSMDHEALIGSYDGHVWNPDTEQWYPTEPESNAYALLSAAVDEVNRNIEDGLRPI